MAHQVQVNAGQKQIALPDGNVYDGPVTVTLTNEEFSELRPALFPGVLTDLGAVPDVAPGDLPASVLIEDELAAVADPAAMTSTVAAGATPTKAEFDALQADVVALRTAVVNLLGVLRGPGGPLAP